MRIQRLAAIGTLIVAGCASKSSDIPLLSLPGQGTPLARYMGRRIERQISQRPAAAPCIVRRSEPKRCESVLSVRSQRL
jgi:hypothetical protein